MTLPPRTGGAALADALIANGGDTVYCLPGESFLAFLAAADDRRDRLRVITTRQEGGLAYMAEAHGKLTGRPGLAFVTRAPGACNAAIGLHTAFQDATPLILMIGQSPRGHLGREAFQEIDFRPMFAPLAKHVEEVMDPDRIAEAVNRAYMIATGGRPGPVVLVFPQDVLEAAVTAPPLPPSATALAHPDPAAIAELARRLGAARRPLLIAGGSGWTEAARDDLARFAEGWELPVAAAFRRQDLIDCRSPSAVGALGTSLDPALAERIRAADLIVLAGARLSEMDSGGYRDINAPRAAQALVQVFPAAEEIGRVALADLAIVAAPPPFAAACAALPPPADRPWAEWTRALRALAEADARPRPGPGPVDLGQIVQQIAASLPEDTIICHGAGNYTGWVQRHYPFRRFHTQLAPVNGSMGYAIPAALAAQVVHPDRPAVAFAGDGCFMMTAQELATARLHGLAPVIIVVDNQGFGTIRVHQRRVTPGHSIATELANPDFVALARAFGAWAERVERTEDFAPALARARASGRMALIAVSLDPAALSSRTPRPADEG